MKKLPEPIYGIWDTYRFAPFFIIGKNLFAQCALGIEIYPEFGYPNAPTLRAEAGKEKVDIFFLSQQSLPFTPESFDRAIYDPKNIIEPEFPWRRNALEMAKVARELAGITLDRSGRFVGKARQGLVVLGRCGSR